MNSDTPCITHELAGLHPADRPRRCWRRVHLAGHEEPCSGCVPRTAAVGYLCPVCAEKARDALDRGRWMISHLRSIEQGGYALGERVNTSMEQSLILPESWIMADQLLEALGAPPIPAGASIDTAIAHATDVTAAWLDEFDSRVNTVTGAASAVIYVRRFQTALKRFPGAEAEYRRIPYMLCPECNGRTLWRKAPSEFLDDITVSCATPNCDYNVDWFEWVDKYAPIFAELDKDMKRRARLEASRHTPVPVYVEVTDADDPDLTSTEVQIRCACTDDYAHDYGHERARK